MDYNEFSRKRWRIFFILVAITTFVQTNIYLLIPNYQLIAQEFIVGDFLLGLMSGSYIFIIGFSSILWGYIVDKVENRKLILIVDVSVASILTFLAYYATNFLWLFVTQVITAFFIGAVPPVIYSMITDLFRPGERIKALNVWNIISSIGSGIGFVVGLFSGVWFSWRNSLLYGAFLIFIAVLFSLILREPPRAASEDILSDLILERGIKYEYKISIEDLRLALLNGRTTAIMIIQSLLVYIAWGAYSTWSLHAFSRECNTDTVVATIILGLASAGTLGAFILAPLADKLRLRRPSRVIVMVACCLAIEPVFLSLMFLTMPNINIYDGDIINTLSIVIQNVLSRNSLKLAVIFGFIGLFAGSIVSPVRDSVIADVNLPEHRATMNSLTGIFSLFGRSLGIVLVGALAEFFFSLKMAIVLIQWILIPTAILWMIASKYYEREIIRLVKTLENRKHVLQNYVKQISAVRVTP